MFNLFKTKLALGTLPLVLLAFTAAQAQYGNRQDRGNRQNRGDFYNGVRDGQTGGHYSEDPRHSYDQNGYDRYGYNRDGYSRNGYNQYGRDQYGRTQAGSRDNRYGDRTYRTDQGGIGPGKGALIGGAGGAILGALFGGGLKGSIIGGAAGAGIGAVVGKEHQTTERRRDGYYPPR